VFRLRRAPIIPPNPGALVRPASAYSARGVSCSPVPLVRGDWKRPRPQELRVGGADATSDPQWRHPSTCDQMQRVANDGCHHQGRPALMRQILVISCHRVRRSNAERPGDETWAFFVGAEQGSRIDLRPHWLVSALAGAFPFAGPVRMHSTQRAVTATKGGGTVLWFIRRCAFAPLQTKVPVRLSVAHNPCEAPQLSPMRSVAVTRRTFV